MSNFIELKEPRYGNGGWYIATKVGDVAWLTVNGDISRDTTPTGLKVIYHKTEGDAYNAIERYYNKHGLLYRYANKAVEDDLKDVNEQQVMRFT